MSCHSLISILNGDLNARTSNHDDTFGSSNTMPHLREYEDFLESEVDTVRVNSDDKVNKFGCQLINICKSYGCLITKGDLETMSIKEIIHL